MKKLLKQAGRFVQMILAVWIIGSVVALPGILAWRATGSVIAFAVTVTVTGFLVGYLGSQLLGAWVERVELAARRPAPVNADTAEPMTLPWEEGCILDLESDIEPQLEDLDDEAFDILRDAVITEDLERNDSADPCTPRDLVTIARETLIEIAQDADNDYTAAERTRAAEMLAANAGVLGERRPTKTEPSTHEVVA